MVVEVGSADCPDAGVNPRKMTAATRVVAVAERIPRRCFEAMGIALHARLIKGSIIPKGAAWHREFWLPNS